jgi:hypothetical protein
VIDSWLFGFMMKEIFPCFSMLRFSTALLNTQQKVKRYFAQYSSLVLHVDFFSDAKRGIVFLGMMPHAS